MKDKIGQEIEVGCCVDVFVSDIVTAVVVDIKEGGILGPNGPEPTVLMMNIAIPMRLNPGQSAASLRRSSIRPSQETRGESALKKTETPSRLTPIVVRDFIVVRPCTEESHTSKLIIVADSARDPLNPLCGMVIGVGCGLVEGGQVVPLKVHVGDHIRFPKNSGTLCKNDPDFGETVFVLRENQVFFRVPGKQ